VVSFGARIISIAAPLSASGLVSVATTQTANNSFDLYSADYVELERYTLNGHESTWVGKPKDGSYTDYQTGFTNLSKGWTYAYISVDGGPVSTAALSLEIIWNVEVTLSSGTSVNLGTPAAPHNGLVEDAAAGVVAHMKSSNPGTLASFGNMVTRMAAGAIKEVVLDGLGMVPVIGGSLKTGAKNAMIMDLN
jgi:hypothetical protein